MRPGTFALGIGTLLLALLTAFPGPLALYFAGAALVTGGLISMLSQTQEKTDDQTPAPQHPPHSDRQCCCARAHSDHRISG
ncbi:hypothetical protein ABMA10_00985 [Plantibacter sp. RU18]